MSLQGYRELGSQKGFNQRNGPQGEIGDKKREKEGKEDKEREGGSGILGTGAFV